MDERNNNTLLFAFWCDQGTLNEPCVSAAYGHCAKWELFRWSIITSLLPPSYLIILFLGAVKNPILNMMHNASAHLKRLCSCAQPVGMAHRFLSPEEPTQIELGFVRRVHRKWSIDTALLGGLCRCPGDSGSHFPKACLLIKCIIQYSPSPMI